jgi:hypothetical protein
LDWKAFIVSSLAVLPSGTDGRAGREHSFASAKDDTATVATAARTSVRMRFIFFSWSAKGHDEIKRKF